MHTDTWNLDQLVCDNKLPCMYMLSLSSWTDCTLIWSSLPSMLYSALYLRLALSCTVDFPRQQLPWIYTFILTTSPYWYYAYLVSFTLICCILSECMLVQNNYVERGLSRLFGGHGELPCDVYDVTSWSYVNLDDPLIKSQSEVRLHTGGSVHFHPSRFTRPSFSIFRGSGSETNHELL